MFFILNWNLYAYFPYSYKALKSDHYKQGTDINSSSYTWGMDLTSIRSEQPESWQCSVTCPMSQGREYIQQPELSPTATQPHTTDLMATQDIPAKSHKDLVYSFKYHRVWWSRNKERQLTIQAPELDMHRTWVSQQ